ncbi:hypothetical protein P389DRAFT_173479 [Cystobasidium minutum MCA 4210]|uniref:uncharacterized protein n=1 Tax=Cystobasidium minutum MCA 4210 TaxID=1397322 RepID=UPI0034CDC841|eukprot:jgi/Rhomi1/173479/fgenesh1_kg.6_\
MARSSQDAHMTSTNARRKTTHVEAKERILYNTASRETRSDTVQDRDRENIVSSRVQYEDERTQHRPRYTDSIVPLKHNDDDDDNSNYLKRSIHYQSTTSRGAPHSDSKVSNARTMKPQVSLSNMFDVEDAGQRARADNNFIGASTLKDGQKKLGRLRSLSDTSIYARKEDGLPFERGAHHNAQDHPMKQENRRDDDDISAEYVNEDEYARSPVIGNENALACAGKHKQKDVPSSDDSSNLGQSPIDLTEFAKSEKKIAIKQVDVKEKTLIELADPMITELTQVYEDEWTTAISEEEILYKETAKSLGALLDNQMLTAAYKIKKETAAIADHIAGARQFVDTEARAAKGAISEHLQFQIAGGCRRLKPIEARMAKRDEQIISDIRAIREKYAAEHAKLEDEYSKKADAVEDRIESLKNEKKIESGFISYITNFRRGQQTASSKPKSAKRGSR